MAVRLRRAEVVELRDAGGHHAVGTRRAPLVEHEIHPIAVLRAEGEGEVVVAAFEKDVLLVLGEEHGVHPQRFLLGQDVLGNRGERAVLADEGPGAGREVEVARAEFARVDEELAHGLGQRRVVHGADLIEGELWGAGGRGGGGRGRGAGAGGGGRRRCSGSWRGCGRCFVEQRVARWRAGGGPGHGVARDALKFSDVGDDAVVDQLLRVVHQLGFLPDGHQGGAGLVAGEQLRVEAEPD